MESEQELATPSPTMDLDLQEAGSLLEVAQKAEKLIAAVKMIKTAVIQLTNENDWIDEGGKPYLQVSGAEKIATMFGIEWDIPPTPDIDQQDDGHRIYKFPGTFTMGKRSVSIIGSRGSKDPFFSRAKGADIPANKINMANVEKAAYTNTIGNGVTRILGIRNMTWDELGRGGIKRNGLSKVEYKTTNQSGIPERCAPNFGPGPGAPLASLDIEQLELYAGAILKSVQDPARVKFKAKNEKMLGWIDEEIQSREPKNLQGTPKPEYSDPEDGEKFSLMGGE